MSAQPAIASVVPVEIGWRLKPLDRARVLVATTDDAAALFIGRLFVGPTRDPYLDAVRQDPCAYCDADGGTIDHIDPRGRDTRGVHNVTASCATCNHKKGDKPLLLWLLAPRPNRKRQSTPAHLVTTPPGTRHPRTTVQQEITFRDRKIVALKRELKLVRDAASDSTAGRLRKENRRLRQALSFIAYAPTREGSDPVTVARAALSAPPGDAS